MASTYCPHTEEAHCCCRKPQPGLALRAAEELGFDSARCFVVGDRPCDIDLGRALGAATVLVRTGYGANTEKVAAPDFVVADLREAAGVLETLVRHFLD